MMDTDGIVTSLAWRYLPLEVTPEQDEELLGKAWGETPNRRMVQVVARSLSMFFDEVEDVTARFAQTHGEHDAFLAYHHILQGQRFTAYPWSQGELANFMKRAERLLTEPGGA